MRTFKRDFLPDSMEYKGETLFPHTTESVLKTDGKTLGNELKGLTAAGRKYCLVEVLHPALVGHKDWKGRPHVPQIYIFASKVKKMETANF